MAWTFGGTGRGEARDFVREGNLDMLLIKDEEQQIQLLVEEPNLEQIAKEKKLSAEEADEFVRTKLLWERWTQPIAVWEHTIPAIPQVRYFASLACQGKTCSLCAANMEAKENGVTENKLLPFPIKKRFVVPIWSYRLGMAMFFKQNEEFFTDMGGYVGKNGVDIIFTIWRTGKGLQTKYKLRYDGKATQTGADIIKEHEIKLLLPKQVDWTEASDDIDRKLGKAPRGQGQAPSKEMPTDGHQGAQNAPEGQEEAKESTPEVPGDPPEASRKASGTGGPAAPGGAKGSAVGTFVVPFGNHKGQTLADIAKSDPTYLKFLSDRGSGILQQKVKEYLGAISK